MDNPLPYQDASLPVEIRVADLLARMTIEEKVAQIMHSDASEQRLWAGVRKVAQEQGSGVNPDAPAEGISAIGRNSLKRSPRQSAETYNRIQDYLRNHTRLGIPALFIEEALHGLMATGATHFPQAIALASTWDPALAEQVFTAAAREARSRGSNLMFTPVLDLAREPRWGRTEETYGEDPYLVSRMGVAAVRGLQGSGPGVDRQHVLATAKHYAVHGQPEGGTNSAPANYSERIIREQFLAPFRAAIVEAGAQAVMASYNEVDGVPSHINPWLLQQVLRKEWGFGGMVTSDGSGVEELVRLHHVAAGEAEAARKALQAGIDFELGRCFQTLVEQVRYGYVPQTELDRAAGNVLRLKFALGLFDDPFVDPDEAEQVNNCEAHRALALQAARQALVLLKNEANQLPLRKDLGTLAVIGPNAADLHLGGYSYDPGRGVSILEGIRAYLGDAARVLYAEGCRISEPYNDWRAWWHDEVRAPDPVEDEARIAAAVEAAAQADVILLLLGENEATCREGWSKDHLGDRDTLDLPGRQEELARRVVETGKPVVVLLLNGRPLSINYLAETVPAIFEGWYLGQEGGTAFAEVLFGDVSPSGKLPVTFPRSVGHLPAYYYQKPSAKRGFLFGDLSPLYPFGHGLSYTTFDYAKLKVEPKRIPLDGTARASVEVTNTGRRAGAEVVQLYVHDVVASLTRPVQELKGFRRVELQPGETRTVTFQVGPAELSFVGADMQPVVEPGEFEIMMGSSSREVRMVTLEVG